MTPERNQSHPTVDELKQALQGLLPDDKSEQVEQHLEDCPECLQITVSLEAEDTLVQFRRPQQPEATSADDQREAVKRIIARLRSVTEAISDSPDGAALTGVAAQEVAGQATGDVPTTAPFPLDFLAPPQQPDEMGRLGQFRVLRQLGAGGMGLVFEAEDMQLSRRVAIKTLRPEITAKPGATERFLREARAAAAMRHDHIVTIHHVGREGNCPFIVEELLEGESLEDRLKRSPMLISEALHIAREMAEGLAAAHAKGLVHRDIKPANVWLEERGVGDRESRLAHSAVTRSAGTASQQSSSRATSTPPSQTASFRVKLLDFGLARVIGQESGLTQSGTLVGTPAYMSPEQAAGDPVDHRSDLFSLGSVLYRMLTGRLPFVGENVMQILSALALRTPEPPVALRPDVPAMVSDFVMQLLSKKPGDRPASARLVIERLASSGSRSDLSPLSMPGNTPNRHGGSVTESPPHTSPKQSIVRPPHSKERPTRTLTLALAAAAVLLLAVGAYFAPQVIRIVTNKGQIVIETDGAGIEVVIKDGQGTVLDTETKREITFNPGHYNIEVTVKDSGGEQRFVTDQFTLTRGRKHIVKAKWEVAKAWLPSSVDADGKDNSADTPAPSRRDRAAPDMGQAQLLIDDDFSGAAKLPFFPRGEEADRFFQGRRDIAKLQDHRLVLNLKPRQQPPRFSSCGPPVDCVDFVCEVRALAAGKGDSGWAIFNDDGGDTTLWVMIRLDGGVEVNESGRTAATAFRHNLGTFRAPSASPTEGFTTVKVQRRGQVLKVFVNGEAVCDPLRLEREYAAGHQYMAVWGRGPGEVTAEFARYTLWRLP